jgi:hypothetical protein
VSVTPGVGIANWGPLVIGTDVDDAVLATLRTWMPTYLRQLHDERNMSFNLAKPRTYANTVQGQEYLDHQLPAIVCTTANLQATLGGVNTPYQGQWQSLVAVVLRGKTPAATRYLAAMYGGTIARLLMQQHGAVADELHYQGLRYEQVPDATGQGRWLLAAVNQIAVFSDEVLQPWGGPDIPDAETYLDEAVVTEVDLTILGETLVIDS